MYAELGRPGPLPEGFAGSGRENVCITPGNADIPEGDGCCRGGGGGGLCIGGGGFTFVGGGACVVGARWGVLVCIGAGELGLPSLVRSN